MVPSSDYDKIVYRNLWLLLYNDMFNKEMCEIISVLIW